MRRIAVVFGILVAILTSGLYAGEGHIRRMREPIRGQYLVMLKNEPGRNVKATAASLVHRFGGKVDREFQAASTGFAISMTDAQAAALSHDPMVRFVEEVAVVHLSSEQTSAGYWLDRLDSSYDGKYWYCEKAADVTAYMIDTGVWVDHSEFQTNGASRVLPGNSWTSGSGDYLVKTGDSSDYGYFPFTGTYPNYTPCAYNHGTMTASILAGNTYGVAKGASIVPLRIFKCSDFTTTTVYLNYAIDWIMSHYNPYRANRPAVLSMSVFQFVSDSCASSFPQTTITQTQASYLENEIDALLGYGYNSSTGLFYTPYVVHETGYADYNWDGIPVVVSANNLSSNAGDTTPARMAYHNSANFSSGGHVISVGGVDNTDALWSEFATVADGCGNTHTKGSNYGDTVDIYASASNITGAWVTSTTATTATNQLSGTSFSAPIVAGLIARLQQHYGTMTPAAAWSALQSSSALPSSAIEPSGTNNKLVARMYGQSTCSTEYP